MVLTESELQALEKGKAKREAEEAAKAEAEIEHEIHHMFMRYVLRLFVCHVKIFVPGFVMQIVSFRSRQVDSE